MTLHLIPRIALTVAMAVGLALPAAGEAPDSAAFLEGTVAGVPWNTAGKLNLTDSKALHFDYGDARYTIPAEQLTGYKWEREANSLGAEVSGGASKIGETVLPMFFEKTHYLTVHYKAPGAESTERAVFQIQKEIKEAADPLLKAWVKRNIASPLAASDIKEEDTWWGNRYWRTRRNRHVWEKKDQPASDSGVEVANRDE